MKDYKLISEQQNHFEVHHPKEGAFKVAKNLLDEQTLKRIRGMPKAMADGGEVEADDEGGDSSNINMPLSAVSAPSGLAGLYNRAIQATPTTTPDAITSQPLAAGTGLDQASPGDLEALQQRLSQPSSAPTAPLIENASFKPGSNTGISLTGGMPQSGQSSMPFGMPDYTAGLNKEAEGVKAAATAQQQGANEIAKIQQDLAKQQDDINKKSQLDYSTYQTEDKRLSSDYASSKIDPMRVWSNMSTGNKVLASIGVLLSGVGSGMAGGPNMAMQIIGKTIDADVEAQKAEMGKKSNLVSENYRRFGNMRMAEDMTRTQLLSATQARVAASAAKMGGAMAQAKATEALGLIENEKAKLQMGMAVYNAKTSLMSGGTGGSGATRGIDPVFANRVYPGQVVNVPQSLGGGVQIAKTKEAATDLDNTVAHLGALSSLLDETDKFQKEVGTAWSPTNKAKASELHNGIVLEMGKLHGLNRMSDVDKEVFDQMASDPGAFFQDKNKAKTQAIRQFVQDKFKSEFGAKTISFNPGKTILGPVVTQPPVATQNIQPASMGR